MWKIKAFCKKANTWSSNDFSNWILTGYTEWYDSKNKDERHRAFEPISFNINDDVGAQIIDLIHQLKPRQRETFRDGLVKAISCWSPHFHRNFLVLRELLLLCEMCKPNGLIPILRKLVFKNIIFFENEETKIETLSQIISTICAYPYEGEVKEFLEDVRASQYWNPRFASMYLISKANALNMNWLNDIRDLNVEFDTLNEGDFDFQVTLKLLTKAVGFRQIVLGFWSFIIPEDGWIIECLFGGTRPPIHIAISDDEYFFTYGQNVFDLINNSFYASWKEYYKSSRKDNRRKTWEEYDIKSWKEYDRKKEFIKKIISFYHIEINSIHKRKALPFDKLARKFRRSYIDIDEKIQPTMH